jgi:hypothetical protein
LNLYGMVDTQVEVFDNQLLGREPLVS